MAVFHLISQQTQPLGIQDLLLALGTGYVERTVRRWLSEMVAEGVLERIGDGRDTKYQVVQTTKTISSACFTPESAQAIAYVRQPLFQRLSVAYADEWIDAYEPNTTFYISSNLRERLYTAGKRSKDHEPAGTYAHHIFNRLLIDLSYNSSRLEGNTYSLLDTERLILQGKGAEGKLEIERLMILNHKEAIRYLVDKAPRLSVTKEVICTVHYLLAEQLVDFCYAGKVRDQSVRIGGSTYVPFESPKRLEHQLEKVLAKAARIQNPYEQSIFLLAHLSYLQAFLDVNKRMARLSANIPLIKENLVPLSFNDVDKEDYTAALLAIYELQDIRPMVDLYAFSYMRTCALYDSTMKAVGFDEIRVRYRQQRRAVVRQIILQCLSTEPEWKEYALAEANALIPPEDREPFLQDLAEDLEILDEIRIAGLGVTPEQLHAWLGK